DATTCETPVADLTPLRRADEARLADAVRREVVVQHERLAALAFERIDDLRIAAGAERRDDQCLRLAAREERGAVRPRQHADGHGDRPHGPYVTAVDTRLAAQHSAAHDLLLEALELALDLRRAPARRLGIGERGETFLPELAYALGSELLRDDAVCLAQPVGDRPLDGARERLVAHGRSPLDLRLARLLRERLDRLDGDLHLLVAEHDRAEHHVLG